MASIFLSHSQLDKHHAQQIYLELKAQGLRAWLDEAEIKPGESIIAKIEQAIDEMDYLGVLLSPRSVNSPWVLKELRMALTNEIYGGRVRVVGLQVADCKPPGFLLDKKYIDFRKNFSGAIAELANFLKGREEQVSIPKQAVLAGIAEQANDELWGRLNCAEASDKSAAADLLRSLTGPQLEAAVALGANWGTDKYKIWESHLIGLIQERVSTDVSGARQLLRELEGIGALEKATDLDYRGREQAYTQGDILWVIKRVARRSGLFSYLPRPEAESLSALLGYQGRFRIHGKAWSAANYGSPVEMAQTKSRILVLVTRESPPRTWLFRASNDTTPEILDQVEYVLWAPSKPMETWIGMEMLLVGFSIEKFDDLGRVLQCDPALKPLFFEPLRRQSVLTCRIGKVTALLPSRCGAKKRSPCLLRGKINQTPTSRCSHRRDENTCKEPCSPAFYACMLEQELQCSFVNGKNGHDVASQPREFVTTRWSVILSAANGSEEEKARDALAELCRTYWRPIFSFVQLRDYSVEDAQDLTQDFFVIILKKNWLQHADRNRGRFRSLLLRSLQNFLINAAEKTRARKRGGDAEFISWDDWMAEAPSQLSLPAQALESLPPERLFDLAWATTVVEHALHRLREECESRGKLWLFQTLSCHLTDERDELSYAKLSTELGMAETAVKKQLHNMRQRYRSLLRDEVSRTVEDPSDVDDEIRYLCAALATGTE